MKIKKLGHCCLVIEEHGKRIMTDPGSYTISEQEVERNIDLVVITHEHADHLHVESLKNILAHNPSAVIVTNTAVGKILDEAGIVYSKLEEGQSGEFVGILLEGYGDKHAEIYQDFGIVQNTGYFFNNKFFYPGDSFTNPGKPVDILALPVLAPWLKIKDSIEYAISIKPRICFPVHDWNIKSGAFLAAIPSKFLEKENIQYNILEIGKEEEL